MARCWSGPGSLEGEFIDWLTIGNQAASVTDDVRRIRSHPLVPSSVAIHGYIYDVPLPPRPCVQSLRAHAFKTRVCPSIQAAPWPAALGA